MDILTLFCKTDDFFLMYEAYLASHSLQDDKPPETRGRRRGLHASEVMTILIAFHQSNYRTLKHFYEKHVYVYWSAEFPNLVSYSRFVQLQQEVLGVLTFYLYAHFSTCSGISFVDSTRLRVCDNRRISAHRVFAAHAGRGKTSMGWFYGFKLHLVINDSGEILAVRFTTGNTDDRRPVPALVSEGFFGSLYADKGYLSKALRETLSKQGVTLIYKVRKNMQPKPMSTVDAMLLKKRVLIESVIKELKTQTQLEHTRHRSLINFQVNAVAALIAYMLLETKPSLNLRKFHQLTDLPMPFNF